MCKDRPASACPGEWEPGCDLGDNGDFVRVHDPAAPQAAPVDPVQPEPLKIGYMPSYGHIPWADLRALVAEAQMGVRDAKYCDASPDQGHQEVRMNWNSLNRIVSTFATPPAAQGAEPPTFIYVPTIHGQSATQEEVDAFKAAQEATLSESPLPCDVKIGHTTFRKGVNLSTLVGYTRRLQREAYGEPPTPEQQAHNLAVLQGRAEGRAEGPLQGVPMQGADDRAALRRIKELLTNLQPHISQACLPGHAGFIDNYVDPALEIARAALGVHEAQPTATSPDAADGSSV